MSAITDNQTFPSSSQWIFPVSALLVTPSIKTSDFTLQKELYDRSRGVEFLFRLGSSLNLPSTAMFTAATWFHRFFMRYSMEDYHRQDVAASCIFLATKTEECGRKLRDVARVCEAKIANTDVPKIPADGKEVELRQTSILLTEEILLEALCFDFVVDSPHGDLVDLFHAHSNDLLVQEYAWSIAHDSYRTPLCLLYPPKAIAAACYILAQRIADGTDSASLDERVSSAALTVASSNIPPQGHISVGSPHSAFEFFNFSDSDLKSVADSLTTMVEFYAVQDGKDLHPHISALQSVEPPSMPSSRIKLYQPPAPLDDNPETSLSTVHDQDGNITSKYKSDGLIKEDARTSPLKQRLDLS